MHELSLAHSIVELVVDQLPDPESTRVDSVTVSIGALSGVVEQSLRFAFDAATVGTPLQHAKLEIETVPVVVWCDACKAEQTLTDTVRLRCPLCGVRTPRILRGRELQVLRVTLLENTINATATHTRSSQTGAEEE